MASSSTSTSTAVSPPTPTSASVAPGQGAAVVQPWGNQVALAAAGLGGSQGNGGSGEPFILGLIETLPPRQGVMLAWAYREMPGVRAWLLAHPFTETLAYLPEETAAGLEMFLPDGRTYTGEFSLEQTCGLGVNPKAQVTLGRDGESLTFGVTGALALFAELGLGMAAETGYGLLAGAKTEGGLKGSAELSATWDVPAGPNVALNVLRPALLAELLANGTIPSARILDVVSALAPSRIEMNYEPAVPTATASASTIQPVFSDLPAGSATTTPIGGRLTCGCEGLARYWEVTVDSSAQVKGAVGISNVIQGLGDDLLWEWSARAKRSISVRVRHDPFPNGMPGTGGEDRLTFEVTTGRSGGIGRAGGSGVEREVTDKWHFSSLSGLLSWVARPPSGEGDIARLVDGGKGPDAPAVAPPDVWVERSFRVDLRDDDAVEAIVPGFLDGLARALPDTGIVSGTRSRRVESTLKVGIPALRAAFGPACRVFDPGTTEAEIVALEQAVLDAVVACLGKRVPPQVAGRDITGALAFVGLANPKVTVERAYSEGFGWLAASGLIAGQSETGTLTIADQRPAPVADAARLHALLVST